MVRTPPMARPIRSPDIHGTQHVEDLCSDVFQSAYAVDGAAQLARLAVLGACAG